MVRFQLQGGACWGWGRTFSWPLLAARCSAVRPEDNEDSTRMLASTERKRTHARTHASAHARTHARTHTGSHRYVHAHARRSGMTPWSGTQQVLNSHSGYSGTLQALQHSQVTVEVGQVGAHAIFNEQRLRHGARLHRGDTLGES